MSKIIGNGRQSEEPKPETGIVGSDPTKPSDTIREGAGSPASEPRPSGDPEVETPLEAGKIIGNG